MVYLMPLGVPLLGVPMPVPVPGDGGVISGVPGVEGTPGVDGLVPELELDPLPGAPVLDVASTPKCE